VHNDPGAEVTVRVRIPLDRCVVGKLPDICVITGSRGRVVWRSLEGAPDVELPFDEAAFEAHKTRGFDRAIVFVWMIGLSITSLSWLLVARDEPALISVVTLPVVFLIGSMRLARIERSSRGPSVLGRDGPIVELDLPSDEAAQAIRAAVGGPQTEDTKPAAASASSASEYVCPRCGRTNKIRPGALTACVRCGAAD
jgi:hypothetical protein